MPIKISVRMELMKKGNDRSFAGPYANCGRIWITVQTDVCN